MADSTFEQHLVCQALAGQPLGHLFLTGPMLRRWLCSLSVDLMFSSGNVYTPQLWLEAMPS